MACVAPTSLEQGKYHPLAIPRTGEKTGHSPSFQVTGVNTISRPIGYVSPSGPERQTSADDHHWPLCIMEQVCMADILKIFGGIPIRQDGVLGAALIGTPDLMRVSNCDRMIHSRATFCCHKEIVSILLVEIWSFEKDAGCAVPDLLRLTYSAGFEIDCLKVGTSSGNVYDVIIAPREIWIDRYRIIMNWVTACTVTVRVWCLED
ncbi:hypothetical protein BDV38DRAFT_284503 [Aspergillus pseudotamarii]|uniref:Uncharacterized protein n=1 Tax=Aspergillus pseudotamarii TaxID=132259 RepID=A0A5N6SPW8_ASPPS|nr:uncharacterized protein BDV38DRAFT_284503 [Aspergillus pseudotamarii]KAE8135820.1 hypothetical protein BDV38DRAFT_284503 [Aspergillus pseudotamarii]